MIGALYISVLLYPIEREVLVVQVDQSFAALQEALALLPAALAEQPPASLEPEAAPAAAALMADAPDFSAVANVLAAQCGPAVRPDGSVQWQLSDSANRYQNYASELPSSFSRQCAVRQFNRRITALLVRVC